MKPVKRLPDAREEGVYFESHPHIAVDTVGNVYATNHLKNRVFKMDPGGMLLREIYSPGQGPGDILHPLGIQLSRNRVFIRDFNGLSWFDDNLKFISTIRLGTFFDDWAMAGENTVFFKSSMAKMLTLMTPEGKELKKFADKRDGRYSLHKKTISTEMVDYTINASQLFSSARAIYLISQPFGEVWKYDLQGNPIYKKTIDLPNPWLAQQREKHKNICFSTGMKAANKEGAVSCLHLFSAIGCSADDKLFVSVIGPPGKLDKSEYGIKLYQLDGNSLRLERIWIIRNIPDREKPISIHFIQARKIGNQYHFYVSVCDFQDDYELYIGHYTADAG